MRANLESLCEVCYFTPDVTHTRHVEKTVSVCVAFSHNINVCFGIIAINVKSKFCLSSLTPSEQQ